MNGDGRRCGRVMIVAGGGSGKIYRARVQVRGKEPFDAEEPYHAESHPPSERRRQGDDCIREHVEARGAEHDAGGQA